MRNIIKKGLLISSLSLIPLVSLSQDSISVTMPQLEAIVLLEHQKLSNENPLLKEQVSSLEKLNQLYVKTDSLQKEEIKTYKNKVASDEKQIQRLKSTQKKTIIGASVGGIVLFILGLIL
jgi:uncharacterized protein YlxW (UPF0749 family)